MGAELIRIFSIILGKRLYETEEKKGNTFAKFSPLLEYVHRNYTENITLDDLVEAGHYSRSYILTLFHQNTGMTPISYINNYRIYKATELLRETDRRVIDIAMETGFQNVAYFIRQFRKHVGTTPLRYRRKNWDPDEGST